MYIVIRHYNGIIMDDPYIVKKENIKEFMYKDYIIYKLENKYKFKIKEIEVEVLREIKEKDIK